MFGINPHTLLADLRHSKNGLVLFAPTADTFYYADSKLADVGNPEFCHNMDTIVTMSKDGVFDTLKERSPGTRASLLFRAGAESLTRLVVTPDSWFAFVHSLRTTAEEAG